MLLILAAWLLGLMGMAALVAGLWSISTYRQLARNGALHPGRVLGKLWLTPLGRSLRRRKTVWGSELTGRAAWVWWSVRWGPAGQSSAVITAAHASQLHLSLRNPAQIHSGTPGALSAVTEVRFTASRGANYRWSTATGYLEPFDLASGSSSAHERARARVCVL